MSEQLRKKLAAMPNQAMPTTQPPHLTTQHAADNERAMTPAKLTRIHSHELVFVAHPARPVACATKARHTQPCSARSAACVAACVPCATAPPGRAARRASVCSHHQADDHCDVVQLAATRAQQAGQQARELQAPGRRRAAVGSRVSRGETTGAEAQLTLARPGPGGTADGWHAAAAAVRPAGH